MYVYIKCILMVLTSYDWVFPPMDDKVVLEEYSALGTGEKQEVERKVFSCLIWKSNSSPKNVGNF